MTSARDAKDEQMLSKAIYTPARIDLWAHCLQHEGSFESNFELIFPASFGILL